MINRNLLKLFFGALLALACSATDTSHDAVGTSAQPLQTFDTGFIPYPTTAMFVNQSSWDGSVVELMAADAFAQCASGTPMAVRYGSDAYLTLLASKMQSAVCADLNLNTTIVEKWRVQREQTPACNRDPDTLELATIQTFSRTFSHYAFPSPASLGVTVTTLGNQAWDEAHTEIFVAEVNLCMAQRLREHMATADVLFASGSDQVQLLSVIRERAQIAMLQYALLAQIFASTGSTSGSITHHLQFLPLLKAWSNWMPAANMARLGSDFAAAVKLQIDATTELGQALLRVDPTNAASTSASDKHWGPGSGRRRLVHLLYGGDPLTANNGTHFADTDVRAPEVHTLFGLARTADALYLRVDGSPFQPKLPLDVAQSASRIYRTVEVWIRNVECKGRTPAAACNLAYDSSTLPSLSDQQAWELWKRHRVTLTHAEQLAEMIYASAPGQGTYGRLHFLGNSSSQITSPVSGVSNGWIHLAPDFQVLPIEPMLRARLLGAGKYFHVPTSPLLYANAREQGFVARYQGRSGILDGGESNRSMRELGAIPALSAVALSMYRNAQGAAVSQPFYGRAQEALQLIRTAAGRTLMGAYPVLLQTVNSGANCEIWAFNGVTPSTCNIQINPSSGGNLNRTIEVVTEPEDTFSTLAHGAYKLEAATAALDPNFKSMVTNETPATLLAPLLSLTGTATTLVDGSIRRTYSAAPALSHMLFVKDTGVTPAQYRLLSSQSQRSGLLTNSQFFDGEYMGYGGSLALLGERAWAVQSANWAVPAYDAFGLPLDWTPPFDPALTGASQGESPVAYYLRSARTAADEATLAVREAIGHLIEETQAEVELTNARTRAAKIDELEFRALCGDSNPSCSLRLISISYTLPDCAALTNEVEREWCNKAVTELGTIVPATLLVAEPVAARLLSGSNFADQIPGTAPPFEEYNGGSLQRLLVQQWTALTSFDTRVKQVISTARARAPHIVAANTQLALSQQTADDRFKYLCGEEVMSKARLASYSYKGKVRGRAARWDPHSLEMSVFQFPQSVNIGPVAAAQSACELARQERQTSLNQQVVKDVQNAGVIMEGHATMLSQIALVQEALGQLSQVTAEIESSQHVARLASERNRLESALQTTSTQTRLSFARRFHSYDLWRARALLENARRLAVAARRTIESAFVVDLSTMRAPEPFVDAPALWADEIYDADLNAPAAVGLSARPDAGDGIFPNKLADYVGNLEAFVQGYSVLRPTAAAKSDAEVLSLPGPELRKAYTQGATSVEVLDGESSIWSFYCADTQTWVQHPGTGQAPLTAKLIDACAGKVPSAARVSFTLDPWARLQNWIAQEPFELRHNTRWTRLAVNLVGTGIRDCALASDPLGCYSDSFLRYDLRHVGPMWVTSYEQQWRALSLPFGRIEGGKALAVEEWLDPVVNGWNAPSVGAVARSEFTNRPVGGVYELVLMLTPDVRLERVERVQILTESSYWVRQQ